jgi:hypothetical protein
MPVKQTKPSQPSAKGQADERAQAIAELVRGGMSYAEAKAALDRSPAVEARVALGKDPGADEEIDPDSIPDPDEDLAVIDVLNEPPAGVRMIEQLYELRGQMTRARKKNDYRLTITLDHRLFDWVLYATIQEAQFRGRPDMSIEDFIIIKVKELKAQDATAGGRRDPSTSGPKDSYNATTGRWSS